MMKYLRGFIIFLLLLYSSISSLVIAVDSSAKIPRVYRKIHERTPLLSPEDLTTTVIGSDVSKAESRCPRSFVFYRYNATSMAFTCASDPSPLNHGLIKWNRTIFYELMKDGDPLQKFLYMDVVPVSTAPFLSKALPSVGQCSLFCLSQQRPCNAFSYSPITKVCEFFDRAHLTHGSKMVAPKQDSSDRKLYFEKLGFYSQLYAPEWGAALNASHTVLEVKKNSTAEDCALKCIVTSRCLSFNFFPHTLSCQLFSSSGHFTIVSTSKEAAVYFPLLETPSPSGGPPFLREDRYLMSPGWPYTLPAGEWKWIFLTPWGKSLSVDFVRKEPVESCLWNISINSQDPFCKLSGSKSGQSNSSLNTVKMTSKGDPNDGKGATESIKARKGFILQTTTKWSCIHDDDSPILLQRPGEIASPNYPEKLGERICKWIIVPNPKNSKVQIQIKDIELHKFSGGLAFTSTSKESLSCKFNSVDDCKKLLEFNGNVSVTYSADAMPIKGFHLSYNFPSEQKKVRISTVEEKISSTAKSFSEYIPINTIVNDTYQLTADNGYQLQLQLGQVILSDERSQDCKPGKLIITDPSDGGSMMTTCWDKSDSTTFVSNGPSLTVQVLVSDINSAPNMMPIFKYSFNVSRTEKHLESDGTTIEVNEDANLTSPNFPLPYNASKQYRWNIWAEKDKVASILRFSTLQLAQFLFNGSHTCDNDRLQVTVDDDKKFSFCGHYSDDKLPKSIMALGKLNIDLTTDDRYEDIGFEAQVQMLPISDGSAPIQNLMGNAGMMFCSRACTWLLNGTNEQAYVIEYPSDCESAQYKAPQEKKFKLLDCKVTEHTLPVGTLIKFPPDGSATTYAATKVFKALYKIIEVEIPETSPTPRLPSTAKSTQPPATTSKSVLTTTPKPGPTATSKSVVMTTSKSMLKTTSKSEPTSASTTSRGQEFTTPYAAVTTSQPDNRTINGSSGNDGIAPTPAPNRVGAIAGSIIGVVIILCIVGFLIFYYWRSRRPGFERTKFYGDPGIENPMHGDSNIQTDNGGSFDNPLAQDTRGHHVDSKADLNMQEY